MKKKLNVVCEDDERFERLSKWKSEDSGALDQVLNTGYNEGRKDGYIEGLIIVGVSLLASAGFCKLITFFKR